MKDCKLTRDWIEALRSGKYAQCKGKMNKDGAFCCLGVLSDVVKPDAWVEHCNGVKAFCWDNTQPHVLDVGFPHTKVAEAVGMTHSESSLLARMNDKGKTFPEIADRIEEMISG